MAAFEWFKKDGLPTTEYDPKDRHQLIILITEYDELITNYHEPEDARKLRLKVKEILHGKSHDYEMAIITIKLALKIIKSFNEIL